KIEPGGGTIRGRAGGMSGAGPERAHGGQTRRAGGGHQLENVTSTECAFGQVRLPQNGVVVRFRSSPALRGILPCELRVRGHWCPDSEVRKLSRHPPDANFGINGTLATL